MNREARSAMRLVAAVLLVLALAGILVTLAYQQLAERRQIAAQQAGLEIISNSIGMQFVRIPAGSFVMGDGEPGRGPLRDVRVRSFYLASTEVTQAQWQAVMGYNPSGYQDLRRPVENVTWLEAQSFLEELNRLEGTNKYRLPTEAEWEYAARAGSTGRFFFGADVADLSRYAWFGVDVRDGTRPVGSKFPNAWGLYDIYGNVWEWVQDCWHEDYTNAPSDSRVWGGGDCSQRVMRGGGWANQGDFLGSALRGTYGANQEDTSNGLRVALSP